MSGYNDTVIAEFRANGGTVGQFGSGLVLLHTVGAKSGEPRIHPVLGIPQPDGSWIVAASAAGAPTHPAWYFNMVAHPQMSIETGTETVEVTATDIEDPDYDAAWGQFEALGGTFLEYKERAGARRIPVVKLSRR